MANKLPESALIEALGLPLLVREFALEDTGKNQLILYHKGIKVADFRPNVSVNHIRQTADFYLRKRDLQKRFESNNEYHKGEWCPYKPSTFCQEGFCNRCQIWKEWCGL